MMLSFAAPQLAQADTAVTKAPAMPWVEEIALPPADPAQADQAGNGIAYLLADTQFKGTAEHYTIWDRFAYTVTDRTGLEQAAAINLSFDPSREKVTLNRLTVIRNGVALDRTEDTTIDVFRREKRAEQGIYDGWLTAHVDLVDIRVGDTIDYAVSYEETPMFPGAPFRDRFAVEWSVPVALIRRKFVWPTSEPLHVKTTGTQAAPTARLEGGDTVRLWEFRNPVPVPQEENVAPGLSSLGLVEVSTGEDWGEIVRALSAAYSPSDPLPPAFAAKLDDIATRFPASSDRMVQALRLVQDEMRYVSLSIGTGSYFPRRPEAVVASGFGDCKDKSLLLAAALRRLGVEAVVALTDLDEGTALDRLLPSAAAFDHAIVRAEIAGRVFWLDATDYLQGGGADTLAQPDYGFALPLSPSSDRGLERMARFVPDEPTTHVREHFAFPKTGGAPLRLTVSTVYRQGDADWMRRQLRSESRAAMRDRYERYYGKTYPGMHSIAPLTVSDDREGNVVTVVERYEQPFASLHGDKFIESFPLRMDLGLDRLPTPSVQNRRAGVWLGRSLHRRDTVTVENLKAAFTPPDDAAVDSPFVSLALKPRVTPTLFELGWTLRTHAQEVPAADIRNYLATMDKIRSNERISYNFSYEEPPKPAGPPLTGDAGPPDGGWKASLGSFLAKAAEAGAAADRSN